MGVKGLWQLLECVGRPVTLESLENKVLGVDASLILNQSVKGMRDKHGNPVRNAHLVGLFSRVCKLLYYRIKPVFVFDGGVPHLKKKTLAVRKERKLKAVHGSKTAAEKIVKNYLKGKALETVTGRKSKTTIRSRSPREPDVFELPEMPSTTTATTEDKSQSSSEEENLEMSLLDQFRSEQLEETYQDPTAVNVNSDDFKALPAEIQHELIKEIKEEKKWMNKMNMPRQANDFSTFQLEGVLKRGKMNQRLDELRKEMNSRNSGELSGVANQDSLGENTAVKSQKILSEDTAHYILIKSDEKTAEKDKQDIGSTSKDFSGEGGFFHEGQDVEVVSWTNPQPKQAAPSKVPSFDIPEICSSDSEILSPLLDVVEAGLSPTSPQAKKSAFSFSPVKNKSPVEKSLLNVSECVSDKEETHKSILQSSDKLGSGDVIEKCYDEDSMTDKLYKRQDQAMKETSEMDNNKDDTLLSQIIDKKKELEDLIKIWENSRKQKAVIDLTASTHDGDKITEDKELPCYSSELLDASRPKEKGEECSNIEEKENSQSALVIGNQTVGDKKTMDTICVSNSDSAEARSVEVVANLVKDKVDEVVGKKSDTITLVNLIDINDGSEVEAKENNEVETKLTDDVEVMETGDAESELVSSDVVMEIAPQVDDTSKVDQEDTHPSPDGEKLPVVEIQDIVEENKTGVPVDEQEAGPSWLPVEWQGTSVESLEEIQIDIESEQQTLATEQARQNRIAATVSNEMFAECQELLQLFGVPYLVSPMEAEAQCAALDVLGLTEGSITDDSDIFLFGGIRVYKNIFNQKRHAELYGSDAVQRNLALNRSKLICVAFITGSDYTEGIQGVGPVGAMEILHEFSGEGLEGLKKFKMWHDEAQKRTKVPQETKVKRKMRSATLPRDFPSEEVFEAYFHPVVDESTERFEWGKPDLHSLRLFASDKLGWSSARTDELLLPVLKQLNNDEKQLKISQFFQVNFQENRNVKSKRIRRVLNRTFNPSSESDDEDGDKTNRNQSKQSTDKLVEKSTKGQGRNRKRTHSTEKKSRELEENEDDVTRPKRAKGGNTKDNACSSAVDRSKGGYRGRGRGRLKLRKNGNDVHMNANTNLELSVELKPLKLSNQEKSFRVSQENHKETSRRGRNQHNLSRPSTSAVNKMEAVSSGRGKGAKTGNEQDTSSSDSPDSEEKNIYAGPKPVSVFHRRRGNGKGNGPARGKKRKNNAEKDSSTSDSTDSEDGDKNVYKGPKPGSVFRQGRGRGKGRGKGRGRGR